MSPAVDPAGPLPRSLRPEPYLSGASAALGIALGLCALAAAAAAAERRRGEPSYTRALEVALQDTRRHALADEMERDELRDQLRDALAELDRVRSLLPEPEPDDQEPEQPEPAAGPEPEPADDAGDQEPEPEQP